jgi:hypothetical protein
MMPQISFVRNNRGGQASWLVLAFALFLTTPAAHAQHLVFTTVTPGTSPVWISSPEQSKDFGFQTLDILNDSDSVVSSVHLKVTLSVSESSEEMVDSGHVYVLLDPGEERRLDVFLGRIDALNQKLRAMRHPVAWVKVTVESVEFADGSRWDPDAPAVIQDPPLP